MNNNTEEDVVNYIKNEINFSKKFCEDEVFVTLRIEAIENILANRERLEKENDNWEKYNLEKEEEITQLNNKLVEAEAKANKYDNLVEKMKEKIERIKNETWYIDSSFEAKQSCIEELQELLDTVEEEKTCEK